jgi:HAD superfamily hydrolase (TIGR01509 family)
MTDVLLLDVMGTLVHDPFHHELPAFFEMTLEQVLAQKHPDAWVRFEHGELEPDAFLRAFFADGRAYDHEGLMRVVEGAYRFLDGIEPLLAELRERGVPMYALSNYPRWYELIEGRLRLSRYLDWRFVSCLTGVRKPDPEAYLGPARVLEVTPERCLFVDDREGNCAAARAVGMPALRFTDAPTLRASLVERGLL